MLQAQIRLSIFISNDKITSKTKLINTIFHSSKLKQTRLSITTERICVFFSIVLNIHLSILFYVHNIKLKSFFVLDTFKIVCFTLTNSGESKALTTLFNLLHVLLLK